MKPRVTAERLRELLDYAPETGLFYWRKRRGSAGAGREAGSWQSRGYRVIAVDRVVYYAHRLAWQYVHGEYPSGEIDHINGDRTDDRIMNLRQCSRRENARNIRTRNLWGFKGVFRSSARKWCAQIAVNGSRINLGSYDSPEKAAAAYDAAARLHYGEFARTNAGSATERACHNLAVVPRG